MKIKTFIGWDIGGSNTKISIIKSNKAKSEVHEIELWHDTGLSKLKKLISDLGTNQNGTYHGITLSGEMCDIFPSRKNGINTTVSPKKGRCVFFDGLRFHASSKPTQNSRFVINYNFIP